MGNKYHAFHSSASGTGAKEIVAAVSGKVIRVLSYVISPGAATVMTLLSSTDHITGAHSFVGAVLAPVASGYNPFGHCQTVSGEALQGISTVDTTWGATVTYELIDGPA